MSGENPFLLEGYDFIEESTPFTTTPLEFKEVTETDISESKNTGSDYKIIGKVRGCMAPIGVHSRNHRIYEDYHWPKVLANPVLQERLANRSLYGMPSHMQKPIDDEDFREGRISHIVSVLEVRKDDKGNPFLYGEFDILNTPAGRILKAMYEGGAGIYVSTRAAGRLLPIPGDPVNKRVDSDSYFLGGIDCVLNPGFLQAKPAFEAVSAEMPQTVLQEAVEEETNEEVKYHLPDGQKEDSLTTLYGAKNSKRMRKGKKIILDANEEVEELRGQVDKLARIIEKVVSDVYEPVEEEVQKQPIVEPDEKGEAIKTEEIKRETKLTEENQAALISLLALLPELNVSEEAIKEALDIVADKLKG